MSKRKSLPEQRVKIMRTAAGLAMASKKPEDVLDIFSQLCGAILASMPPTECLDKVSKPKIKPGTRYIGSSPEGFIIFGLQLGLSLTQGLRQSVMRLLDQQAEDLEQCIGTYALQRLARLQDANAQDQDAQDEADYLRSLVQKKDEGFPE
jgi:hypothetical protein